MADFNARAYWERRLGERFSLDGVGWIGLGTAFNGWMYRVRRRVFQRAVRDVAAQVERLRVLDIGSGTGFYVGCWHELGVERVSGADITDTAVDRLRQRYPTDRFERFDIGGAELPFEPGSFDTISCMDVLFHIVDDDAFRRALRNVCTLLAPGGYFLFSDNCLRGGEIRTAHQASRSLDAIEEAVGTARLELVERRPMFVLLNTPLDSSSRLLHGWWRMLTEAATRMHALGGAIGALVYPVELALVWGLREGPSTELIVCRRPPE